MDPAESTNCTTGYSGMQPERTVSSPGFDTPEISLAAIPSPLKHMVPCLPHLGWAVREAPCRSTLITPYYGKLAVRVYGCSVRDSRG